ncbi:hypothetical protein [Lewinella sp. W8]|uniref:hypothetical protein n=1 Tax=Lewinella sp. W8 TaxID=2528208 RepID=UPI001067D8A1|nr:hypothetical protein [Lewinella sp. W8]MTB51145.1 hypothetical protein [Lewinella sp. W8]
MATRNDKNKPKTAPVTQAASQSAKKTVQAAKQSREVRPVPDPEQRCITFTPEQFKEFMGMWKEMCKEQKDNRPDCPPEDPKKKEFECRSNRIKSSMGIGAPPPLEGSSVAKDIEKIKADDKGDECEEPKKVVPLS